MGVLTTLTAVKLHLGISTSDTSDDALITQLINQASADISERCNRTLTRETRTAEMYTGDGGKKLYLDLYPATEVAAVTLDGEAITDYVLTPKSGLLYREDGWTKNFEIAVTYTGGYQLEDMTGPPAIARDMPFDLEYATILWVATAYNTRGSEHLSDEAIGPLKSVFWQEQPALAVIVNRYRRIPI